ncbi:MAG TPA: FAD-dependent oxidoreductase [Planctomycetota bacterium]|jgi:heterodisulfide reductase subunit A-like polyferredoxin
MVARDERSAGKRPTEPVGAVLVCGAGIAGIQAALDLAASGFKVYLLESSPAIGGRMAQLDKTFPTGDCAMCTLSPKLVEIARNKNVDIITLADIEGISGEPGNFQVKIRKRPRFVDLKKCNACGDCSEACPVSLPSEFDRTLGTRKAIFRPYPQAIPNVYGISKAAGKAPCKANCPAGVNVQGYVALIAKEKFKEAYDLIRERCPLPSACGRVCQHPCETKCNRSDLDQPVAARDLKRFAGDWVYSHKSEIKDVPPQAAVQQKEKVAIIGGGPAGLTAASDLRLLGYSVTIFDAQPKLGGMLRYGIPRYRLPENVLDEEIQYILSMGVDAKTNTAIADPAKLLKSGSTNGNGSAEKFDAVFVGIGAWTSRKLGVPGEDASGVWPGLKFLHDVNAGERPAIGPNVLVIGGGDVAMDAARCARRLPGVQNVHLACLEKREEMPAHSWEAAEALEEGVVFHPSLGPTKFATEHNKVTGVTFRACTRVFDENKKFSPQFDDSQTSTLAADTVIVTIGQGIDSAGLAPIATGPGGRISADRESLATNIPGIFAGGDAVLGPASMVDAMAHGHRAASAIDAYLRGTVGRASLPANAASGGHGGPPHQETAPVPDPDVPRAERKKMAQAPVAARVKDFSEIDRGYSKEDAVAEAKRCLACGLCSECGQCVKACAAGAICHDMQPTSETITVGSVVLTPGYDEFNPALKGEFGHGRYKNVLSSIQFERLLSAAGPTSGDVIRPSDAQHPKSIAFIQCVGSRDTSCGNGYCSSICCTAAAKQAMVALEHMPGTEISVFCMDVRAFGKEFDQYVNRARDEHKVKFIRAMPSRIVEMPGSKNVRIRYFDENGKEQQQEFGLVVLSVGLKPSASVKDLAGRLGLELNSFGFCQTDRLAPVTSSRPGIYVAGAFQEPKDIPESVAQASAAAACAMEQLATARGSMIQQREYPWERDTSDQAPRIGVFICHCGHNIASVIDVNKVAEQALKMPNVVHAEASLYTCSDTNQQHIKDMIREHRLNRLVVASCTPRTHEVLFQETLREAGLNQYLFAMTNIRDQCSWVHRDDHVAATAKAVELMRMAVGRARHLKSLETGQLPVNQSALVIGGGLAGMTAALSVAEQGFDVHLIEKEAQLGGNLRQLYSTLEKPDVQPFLKGLLQKVQSNPRIKLRLGAQLNAITGHVGNFKSEIKSASGTSTIQHGVVIVATGGAERPTDKYGHGSNPRVLTQREVEAQLHGASGAVQQLGKNSTIVMLQCVNSRTTEHVYCSRVCCADAVKNALALKAKNPGAQIYVLAKDIRTYGFRETYFQQAREAGIIFVRYPQDKEPAVDAKTLEVSVLDAGINRELKLKADLLVLSTGIAPAADNPVLSSLLRTSLTTDGFFLEAHPKLRPVDVASEGIFVCGLSHSPRFSDETIAQAQAAAARAATILAKPHREVPGQISRIDPLKCIACMTCVKVCPYDAPALNAEIHKAEVQTAKCMGCGSCASTCPAKAITLQHQEEKQVIAQLDELLVGGQ